MTFAVMENGQMDDLISRQKAINTVNAMFKVCDTGSIEDFRDLMIAALADLPPSQPWVVTDECILKPLYLDRTGNILECHKCIFRGTDECQYKGGN